MKKNKNNKAIAIFENEPVRRAWSDKEEKWYFSVVDVARILTESVDARNYWKVLKNRLIAEGGNQTVTDCNQLKLMAIDGRMRLTDVADIETMFRIIQSIPSPKAEPFKIWLAKIGYERLKEAVDPEIAVNRARANWQSLGRSEKWIEQRMRGQEIRNKLTDYWATHEVTEQEEFAILTNIIHKEWSGLTVGQHKKIKNLKGHNLRDNMTDAEMLFTSLAELTTRQVAEKDLSVGLNENAVVAKKGGKLASRAKNDFEKLTGKKVISQENFLGSGKRKLNK
ncbi:MAG TPA: hypothetical protein DCS28_03640 [Candidatus Moranbacteria bacterium]|nr:hypothetical protein [Candidatus Moranbacteria bacterium]HAT75105.1 hypothetical protein [Candidatus Moranbacteria bacterium]